jgi:hypothetical protein
MKASGPWVLSVSEVVMSAVKFSSTSCAVLACALFVSIVPAKAEDEAFDIQILNRVLSAVGLRDDKPVIEYRERSPLVLPPTTALPSPVAGTVSDPNWPLDPDTKAARLRDAQGGKVAGATGDPTIDDASPRAPSEPPRSRSAKRAPVAGGSSPRDSEYGRMMAPGELGSPGVFQTFNKAFGVDKPGTAKFTGEPARTSLIEPPTGYQTPAANQPYGVGKPVAAPVTPYITTHGTMDK